MLLGAARYLAETRNFDGTVQFIFQPAEENVAGGRVMVEDGLFEKFPVQDVYGMHNMPGKATGKIVVRKGPMMACADFFEVKITGKGVHGAMPHLGVDPVVVSAQIILAWQTIVSRAADPMESAVISVTQVNGGFTSNVIPEEVTLVGTVRAFQPTIQDMIEEKMAQMANNICAAHGATCTFDYQRRYPPVINTEAETDIAAAAAADVVGQDNVLDDEPPTMGAEDFAWMLQEKPGSYIWIGNGEEGTMGGCAVHNPHYDFNDEILTIGASYWAQLVHSVLKAA
jgi:hippurate hydrolase